MDPVSDRQKGGLRPICDAKLSQESRSLILHRSDRNVLRFCNFGIAGAPSQMSKQDQLTRRQGSDDFLLMRISVALAVRMRVGGTCEDRLLHRARQSFYRGVESGSPYADH